MLEYRCIQTSLRAWSIVVWGHSIVPNTIIRHGILWVRHDHLIAPTGELAPRPFKLEELDGYNQWGNSIWDLNSQCLRYLMVPVSEGPLKVGTELDVKLRVWCSEHGDLWAHHTEYGRGDGRKNIIVQVLNAEDRIPN